MRRQEDVLPEQALAEFVEGQRFARQLGAALRAAQLVPEGFGSDGGCRRWFGRDNAHGTKGHREADVQPGKSARPCDQPSG
jgi:hypothetical protein